jgi:hypothetical protein
MNWTGSQVGILTPFLIKLAISTRNLAIPFANLELDGCKPGRLLYESLEPFATLNRTVANPEGYSTKALNLLQLDLDGRRPGKLLYESLKPLANSNQSVLAEGNSTTAQNNLENSSQPSNRSVYAPQATL